MSDYAIVNLLELDDTVEGRVPGLEGRFSRKHTGSTDLADEDGGKLVWKVDWPMRWAYERVDFEPAGLDHMTPGSSYTVGRELVSSVFDWRPPARVTYAFVGFAGVQNFPTVGLIVLLAVLISPHFHGRTDNGFLIPTEIVLVLIAIPSILSNTYAGIDNVEPAVRDAAEWGLELLPEHA